MVWNVVDISLCHYDFPLLFFLVQWRKEHWLYHLHPHLMYVIKTLTWYIQTHTHRHIRIHSNQATQHTNLVYYIINSNIPSKQNKTKKKTKTRKIFSPIKPTNDDEKRWEYVRVSLRREVCGHISKLATIKPRIVLVELCTDQFSSKLISFVDISTYTHGMQTNEKGAR